MDYVPGKNLAQITRDVYLDVASLALFDLLGPCLSLLGELVFEDFSHVQEALLVEGMSACFALGLPSLVSRREQERLTHELAEDAHRYSSLV